MVEFCFNPVQNVLPAPSAPFGVRRSCQSSAPTSTSGWGSWHCSHCTPQCISKSAARTSAFTTSPLLWIFCAGRAGFGMSTLNPVQHDGICWYNHILRSLDIELLLQFFVCNFVPCWGLNCFFILDSSRGLLTRTTCLNCGFRLLAFLAASVLSLYDVSRGLCTWRPSSLALCKSGL